MKHQLSEAGLAFTKSFEGLRLHAYPDVAANLTIGYGHKDPKMSASLTITESEADAFLRSDMAAAVECVNGKIDVDLTQCQFDSLCDFCFNVGIGSFLRSTLRAKVNAGDIAGAATQFGAWIDAGGKPEPGLIRRRAAEAAMFMGVGA